MGKGGWSVKGELVGVEDAIKTLKGIRPGRARAILRGALQRTVTPVLDAAKSFVPRETGLLRKSLGRKTMTYPNGTVVVIIGPRHGFRQEVSLKPGWIWRGGTKPYPVRKPTSEMRKMDRNPVKYAHLVELGSIKKGNRAKPFLSKAWEQKKMAASRIFIEAVSDGLGRLLAKG